MHLPVTDNALCIANYKFAAYNTQSNIYSYSTEEFLKYLRDDDWSREETDYLFELCHTYDLRFVVIHDRYDPPTAPGSPQRTLEDLKDRYYACCRRLIRERPAADEAVKAQSANAYVFDKNRETARKQYLRSLKDRTAEQIAEEEYLYVESRRLEQTYSRTIREREDLLRLLGGVGAGVVMPNVNFNGMPGTAAQPQAGLARAGSTTSSAANANTRTKRGRGEDLDPSSYDLSTSKGAGKGRSKNAPKPDPVFDAQHLIQHHDQTPQVSSYGLPKSNSSGGPSVYLRSARMNFVKPALQIKVTTALNEMGISERLVMPTKANADRLEQLSGAVAQLVELKAQVDRVEYELQVARKRKVREESMLDAEAEEDAAVAEDRAKEPSMVSLRCFILVR